MSPQNQSAIEGEHRDRLPGWKLLFLFVLIALCATLRSPLLAQEQDSSRFTINLKAREFIPQIGIEDSTLTKLNTSIIRERKTPHVMIQFKDTPSRKERETLKTRGVKLLSYVGGNAWYATISDTSALFFMRPEITAKYPTLGSIRWIDKILPEDKIHPFLKTKGPGTWAINPDGTIKISIDFFKDVSRKRAREILTKYDAEIESGRTRRISFFIVIAPDVLDSLTNEDEVKSIEVYPPPKKEFNDGSRAWTNTDLVHAYNMESDAAINIQGNGAVLGIWDGNEVDDAHDDLGARVTYGEDPRSNTTSRHSTHVAGTMAGDGTANVPLNLFGHAPQADEIVSYDFFDDVPAEMEQAIEDNTIVAANNSWGYVIGWDWDPATGIWGFNNNQALFGNYIFGSSDYDDIVRKEKLVIVFAIGNDRNNPTNPGVIQPATPADWDQGTGNNGYATVAPPTAAKNIITVGAINDATGNMSNFSNWGPTDDGRIKPDVVAPGNGIWSCDDNPDDGYTQMWGTSMAAPAITGISALLVQAYRDEFFGDVNSDEVPLSSTIKALLVHSAQPLGRPGPDYIFGWGGADADAAYNLLRDGLVIESQLVHDEEDVFICNVPANETEFNATICWDDVPGDHLINDLDLSFEAPNGSISLPWVLDPAPANWANNANTGADHTNNVEQVHVVNPMAGLWKIRINGFLINEPIDNPTQKYSLVSDFPFYVEENVSVVQVIDRSGSMRYRDNSSLPTYMESAKIAAQNFIGLMRLGDEIGVVAFDDEGCDNAGTKAEPRFNLSEITTEIVRNLAVSSINGLDDRGCTSIGAGMQLAQTGPNFLDAATTDNPHAMILLTDGYENRPPWVRERPPQFSNQPATPDNLLLTIPDKTDIYTIALGPSADEDLMKDIANTTGGKFYESPTILGLLSIYYQIQADLELGAMANLGTGTKSGGNDTHSATIDYGTGEATFVVGWLQKEGKLKLTLKDPLGGTVTSSSPNVKTGSGSTYYYLGIPNPLPGDWEVHIIRSDSAAFEIDYTFATFVKGVSKLWSFIPEFTYADDCLLTKVYLYDSRTLRPISGASVKALIISPKKSKYTLHYNYVKPVEAKWQPQAVMSSDQIRSQSARADSIYDQSPKWVSTLQFYDQRSLKETGLSIFEYDTTEVILYDDGTSEDEQSGDGYYTNCIEESKIAGSYSIVFSISGVDQSGSNFTRKLLSTASIKPGKIAPIKTLVRVDPRKIDLSQDSKATITIVPEDSYGNVWGPGYASRISVSVAAGRLSGDVLDNGDGFYFQEITSKGIDDEGPIVVKIDGVEMVHKPKIILGAGKPHKFSASLHTGVAAPTGSYANLFDPGLNVLLDLDYHFSPNLSLVGLFGYNDFKSKIAGVDDNYWLNLSLNARYTRPLSGPWSLYVGAGPGLYIPETGDNEPGANVGFGLDYNYSPRVQFELGVDYHTIFDPDIQFVHSHAGVIFKF